MSRTRVERNISFDDEKKKYYVNLDFGRDARGRQIKKTRTFARLSDARKALRLHPRCAAGAKPAECRPHFVRASCTGCWQASRQMHGKSRAAIHGRGCASPS